MRNLNLPDHTPAPETLAFAHELAALEAVNTAQTRRELLAEVTRLESENATLRQQVDALTSERDAAVAEWQACHNILDRAQQYRAELFPGDVDNSWIDAIRRLAQGVRDGRKWSAEWKRMARGYRRMYLFLTTD